jgi:serine protease Do
MKLALILLLAVLAQAATAQDEADYPALPRVRYRSGQAVLDAFAPISAQTSNSVVELNVDEDPVALGTVVDTNGLILTKASEISAGKLTCWLAAGREVDAQLLAIDDDNDVALVQVKAKGLKPVQWVSDQVVEGQWVITPCLADTPLAVGIISALPHRIRRSFSERALIGVWFDPEATRPIVRELSPGFGAEKAGVEPGDIVVEVDGKSVTNREEVIDILQDFRDGQSVRMKFLREEKEFDETIQLMTPKSTQELELFANESENLLRGDVSLRSEGFDQAIEHDTVLEPWQCGGPLVNLNGKAIGLNIARASRVATYALPASLAREIVTKLKAKAKAEKP